MDENSEHAPASEPLQIDCAGLSASALTQELRTIPEDGQVELTNAATLDGWASGSEQALSIRVHGDAGNYLGFLTSAMDIEVEGKAGHGCGHSLRGGAISVRGSAGQAVAAYAQSGYVAVLSRAANYAGMGLAGADVFIRSTVGDLAGFRMSSGVLVLGNGAGQLVGHEMRGGTLFVRGEVASLSGSVRAVRMKDADNLRLGLILARSAIKANPSDFKMYLPRR